MCYFCFNSLLGLIQKRRLVVAHLHEMHININMRNFDKAARTHAGCVHIGQYFSFVLDGIPSTSVVPEPEREVASRRA